MSCIGALGSGVMLGTALNWWVFAAFATIAIVGSVWTSRLLRTVPNVGLIIKYNFPKDAGYYQNGKRKTTPVNGNDFLYHIKMFLPFIQIGVFIFSAVLFGGPHQTHDTSRNIGALNAENSYKANGLYGHVSDLFFVDENTGIALSSLTYPEKQDYSIKVFHTTDAGHNWQPVLELPCSSAFNAIQVGNYVFCAVKRDSIFTLLSVCIPSGRHTLSNDRFYTLPILFQCDNKLGYAANGVFYTTDNTFETTDSIGGYDKRLSNKGLTMIYGHIYGFIFDKDSCVNRLYDFKDKITVENFTAPGDASLVKTTDKSCLILAARDNGNLMMYDFDGIEKSIIQKGTYAYQIMRPLKIDNGRTYTLVADRPNTDNYLLVGDTSWQSNRIINVNESNIRAYCIINQTFYYYDQFQHNIVKCLIPKLSETMAENTEHVDFCHVTSSVHIL